MGFHISKSLKDPKPEDYLNIFQQLQVDKLKNKNLIGPDEPLKDYNYLLSLGKSHTDIEYEQLEDNKIKPKENITLVDFMIVNNDKLSELIGEKFYISLAAISYTRSPMAWVTLVSNSIEEDNSYLIAPDKPIAYFRDLYIDYIKLNSDNEGKNPSVEICLIMPKEQSNQLNALDFI